MWVYVLWALESKVLPVESVVMELSLMEESVWYSLLQSLENSNTQKMRFQSYVIRASTDIPVPAAFSVP